MSFRVFSIDMTSYLTMFHFKVSTLMVSIFLYLMMIVGSLRMVRGLLNDYEKFHW